MLQRVRDILHQDSEASHICKIFRDLSHLLTQDKAKEWLKVQLIYQLENHTKSGRHTVLRMQFLSSINGSRTLSFKGEDFIDTIKI